MAWHDDDAFWHDMHDVMFDSGRWAGATRMIDELVALLELAPCRVLDMPCGPGRHSLELARRGFDVTGLDRTASYLDEARRRARDEQLSVSFVQGDMRQGTGADFDVVLNLYSSFGYFDDPADDRTHLATCRRVLRPGGRLVIDTHCVETLARVFEPSSVWERDDDLLIERRRILDDWGAIESRWTVLGHDGTRRDAAFRLRLYTGRQLADLAREAGFGDVQLYGHLDGRPFDHAAARLVLVAHNNA